MELLTRQEVIKQLRISPAQFSKIVNGSVRGIAPPPHVRAGRRQLFRKDALEQWFIQMETRHQPHAARVA